MAVTFTMLALNSSGGPNPGTQFQARSGALYTADGFGEVKNVALGDIADLIAGGCIVLGQVSGKSNLTATADPTVGADNTLDYAAGSVWVNTTGNRLWRCISAATGAANWAMESQNPLNFRNMIDGGDFQTNPWQRGTAAIAAANSVTYGPDRFFAIGGASSSIYLTKTANTDIAGFTQAMAFGRTAANADTTAISFGQALESLDCYKAQGQQITLSFWAKKGANYSGGAVTVVVNSGTAADGSAANLATAGWTGNALPINATFTPTSTMTRYQFSGTMAAAALQLGILLTYTPTGTAGSADNILFHGIQLEIGAVASPFEFRDAEVEIALAQRYFFQINEPAAGVVVGSGMVTTTNNEVVFIPLPVQMRTAPTVAVTVGQFKLNIAGTPTTAAGFAAGATHTPNYITVVSTTTATSGQATLLQGNGSTGKITASADY